MDLVLARSSLQCVWKDKVIHWKTQWPLPCLTKELIICLWSTQHRAIEKIYSYIRIFYLECSMYCIPTPYSSPLCHWELCQRSLSKSDQASAVTSNMPCRLHMVELCKSCFHECSFLLPFLIVFHYERVGRYFNVKRVLTLSKYIKQVKINKLFVVLC